MTGVHRRRGKFGHRNTKRKMPCEDAIKDNVKIETEIVVEGL